MGTVANTINASISKLNFDFAKDLAPVAPVATVPNILVAHPSTGIRTVADLVKAAKAKPEPMLYGSSGVGSALHVYGELLNIVAGIKLTHVPYPGSAQSLTDLLAGTHLGDVLAGADRAAAHPVRRADRGRGHARRRAAQPAEHGGCRLPGLRRRPLVRHARARRHAARRSSTRSRSGSTRR